MEKKEYVRNYTIRITLCEPLPEGEKLFNCECDFIKSQEVDQHNNLIWVIQTQDRTKYEEPLDDLMDHAESMYTIREIRMIEKVTNLGRITPADSVLCL